MSSYFMEILQLFLFWAVLGVSIIVKHKVLQSSLIMSIQCFFGPSSLTYLVSSSKYCYLWISVVIHSHNMTKVSQAKLPYPVVYFLPQIEMFPNAIIAQPVSLYNDENPPEKMPSQIHSVNVLRISSFSKFQSCKEGRSRQCLTYL